MPDHNPPSKPSPKLLSLILKLTVMSLILSLFFLFISLAAILLLHLLLAASFLHRRRRQPPSLHRHLPPFLYPATPIDNDCSICLEVFKEGEICRTVPVCDHVFHARCVDTWLLKVPSCPICRTRVRFDEGGVFDSVEGDDENKFLWTVGVGM